MTYGILNKWNTDRNQTTEEKDIRFWKTEQYKWVKKNNYRLQVNDIKVPPPAQLLCEALSVVCDREVEVFPGLGAWGGEGWIKRKKSRLWSPSSSFSSTGQQEKIVLPLIQQQTSSSSDSEWSQLQSALQTITSSIQTNPFCTVLPVRYKKGSVFPLQLCGMERLTDLPCVI